MTTTGSRSVARRLALTVTGHDSKHLDSNGMCVCRCTDCRKRLDDDTSRCVCPDCVEDGLTNDSSIRLQSCGRFHTNSGSAPGCSHATAPAGES